MVSKDVDWIDKLFVIGLIIILLGIGSLSLVGIMFFLSPNQYGLGNLGTSGLVMDAVWAGVILIAAGAVMIIVLNKMGY
jgi:hypothetical protein